MAGQMAEQVAPQVAGDAHEGEARDPAGEPPEQIVGSDEANQEEKCQPDAMRGGGPARQRINKMFHTVLSCDRTADRRQNSSQDDGVTDRPPPDIAKNKRERTIDVAGRLVHRFSALLLPQPRALNCGEALASAPIRLPTRHNPAW